MRSLSTSAFGQPSDTKPTFGVRGLAATGALRQSAHFRTCLRLDLDRGSRHLRASSLRGSEAQSRQCGNRLKIDPVTELQPSEALTKIRRYRQPSRAPQHGAWLEAGRPVAIATVIDTWGSAPVRAGGQMAIAGCRRISGFRFRRLRRSRRHRRRARRHRNRQALRP